MMVSRRGAEQRGRHVAVVTSTGAQLTGGSFVDELDEAQMESRREPTLAPRIISTNCMLLCT